MADYAEVADNEEQETVVITTSDGKTVRGALAELPPAIIRRLALHGLKQKLVDSYSGAKKAVEDGDYETKEEYAFERASSTYAQLVAGDWSARREGTGPRITLLAQAVAEVLGIEIPAATEKLAAMDEETKKKVSKSPKVALVMSRLRKEAEERREQKLREEAAKAGSGDLAGLFA